MEFVASTDELRAGYKTVSDIARRKELRLLDGHCRRFIAASPFLLIGSAGADGRGDVTPRGDRPGFVAVLDDTTLAIPDRPGNNRLDTLENIVANPNVGLLFLIPGMNETLRINGRARVTFDAPLRERLAVDGKAPLSVVVVDVQTAYMHCAKAFMRSGLWAPEGWAPRETMPTLGEILRDQLQLADTAEQQDRRLAEAYKATLW